MHQKVGIQTTRFGRSKNAPPNIVDGKALDYRFYCRVHMEKTHKAFAYRGTMGVFSY